MHKIVMLRGWMKSLMLSDSFVHVLRVYEYNLMLPLSVERLFVQQHHVQGSHCKRSLVNCNHVCTVYDTIKPLKPLIVVHKLTSLGS